MLGSSAIDLAWTAEGRLDACIQLGNKPWDTSAGVLIAREAGARVLDHDGSEHSEQSRSTIAVTPALDVGLMEAVRATLVDEGVSQRQLPSCATTALAWRPGQARA
jgi:myo-inositol-1(or 4)-monophosphatase